jgi:Cu(I)/Ag(I) efflux system membrane protein CusA/SilA
MVGGILTSFILELVVYPALYEIWKWHFAMRRTSMARPDGPRVRLIGVQDA